MSITPYNAASSYLPKPHELLNASSQLASPAYRIQPTLYSSQSSLVRSPQHDVFRLHSVEEPSLGKGKLTLGKILKYGTLGWGGYHVGRFLNNRLGLIQNYSPKKYLLALAAGIGLMKLKNKLFG